MYTMNQFLSYLEKDHTYGNKCKSRNVPPLRYVFAVLYSRADERHYWPVSQEDLSRSKPNKWNHRIHFSYKNLYFFE